MNNYHVYEEIGKGKYSNVYKGRKKKSIEYVAVKGLEKSRLKKLLNEVKMFSDLNHPNILKFFSWYESRNHLWVILEYCPGGDLMSLIKADSKGLGEATTKQFIRELASGIMYLHSKGIIYCDLKPSNVLFNEYGNVKISDLGLAKCLVDLITSSEQGPEDIMQKDMSKRGSPYYMAPELFQDGSVYSFQSDLWALGCVAYELATGQPPFVSNSFTELVNLILNADVQKVDNYSSQFNELLRGLLEKDPTKRWTWDKICKHPFFSGSLNYLSIPPQPHFENWCRKNAAIQRQQERLVNSTPPLQQKELSKSPSQTPSSVDILRLSLNVKKNMLREEAVPYEKPQVTNKKGIPNIVQQPKQNDASRDVKLIDRDQEIDIGSGEEVDNEEKDSDDTSPISTEVLLTQTVQVQTPSSPHVQKPLSNKENLQPLSYSNRSEIQVSPSPNVGQSPSGYTPQLKKPNNSSSQTALVPLDQLLTHSSDTAVKPIIGNREIERSLNTQEATIVRENLPFAYISADEVNKAIESDHIESHLEKIYNALSSNISLNDKLNVVNYFEQIVQTSNTANRLLNSAFTPLLLKLIKLSKSSQFKLRICCVIGLLIRHATVIDQDVSSMGIVETMMEILNSRESAPVKRKACAALGEYLFYGATQMDEDQSNVCWEITTQIQNFLLKVLKSPNEDEIVKFYVVKTIENITSSSYSTGYKFATPELIGPLVQLFLNGKNDNLKSSCTISIANIILLDNKLSEQVLQQIGLRNMVQIFLEGTPRIQQAMITIFNLFLIQSLSNLKEQGTPKSVNDNNQVQQIAVNTINRLLMEESNLLVSLVHLLDHGQPVSRGKAALSLMIVIKFNVNTLVTLSDESLRFYIVLDKTLREQNEYLKSCISHLLQELTQYVPWMIQAVSDEVQNLIMGDANQTPDNDFYKDTSKRKQTKQTEQNVVKLKGNLQYLQVLLQFASTPCLQQSIFNQLYLPAIADLLITSTSTPQGGKINSLLSQSQHYLFNIASQLSTNTKVLIKQQESIINSILKLCIEQLGQISVTETRFLFLNFIIELLAALLSEESIYDYPGFLKQYALDINKLVINQLLPQLKVLLSDQPPLPFYALKLIGILLENNPGFLAAMKKNKHINGIIDMYRADSNSITGHTLTVIQKVIDGSSLDEIYQLGVFEKSSQILMQFVATQQEWSFDDLTGIMSSLTLKVIVELSRGKQGQTVNPENTIQPTQFPQELYCQTLDSLLNTINACLVLFPQSSQTAQNNLSLYLLHLTYIFSGRLSTLRQNILQTTAPIAKQTLMQLLPTLNMNLTVTNSNINNYTLFKRSIKLMHWVLILNEQKPIKFDKKDIILQILDRIKQATDDKVFLNAAKEIPRYLL